MRTQQDWEWLAAGSHYQTATAVRELLSEGKSMEAIQGLDELIEAMGRVDKRALRSQLIRLMSHVIKWKCQPERRSSSWSITIRSARREIEDLQEEVPSLNRAYIESVWAKCLATAIEEATDEMDKDCPITSLDWAEVFEENYKFVRDKN